MGASAAQRSDLPRSGEESDAAADRVAILEAFLDSTLDARIAIDEFGVVIEWNRQAEATFGWTRAEALGLPVAELIVPERHREEHSNALERLRRAGSGHLADIRSEWEWPAVCREGSEIPVQISLFAAKVRGEPVYLSSVRDIRERKRAAEATERLAAIVDAADDAIVATDLDNTITSWNRGAERMFGYSAGEAIGQSMLILEPKGYEGETRTVLERAASGEVVKRHETVRRRKDGTLVSVSIIASAMRDAEGRVHGTARIIRDSTAERRDREALIGANEELLRARRELEAILDSGQSGIIAFDASGKVLYHNEAAERLLGTEPQDMPPGEWPERYGIFHPGGETRFPAGELPGARALQGETVRECEIVVVRPGLEMAVSLLVSSAPIRDSDGNVVAAVSTFQDVTELMAARRDLERIRTETGRQ